MTDDISRLVEWIADRTTISASSGDLRSDVKTMFDYGIEEKAAAETLLIKYSETEKPTLFDVKGIGPARAGLLVAAGYGSPSEVAEADSEDIASIDKFSEKYAHVVTESARLAVDDEFGSIYESVSDKTPVDPSQIKADISLFINAGIPPSEAAEALVDLYTSEPSLMDTCSVDARAAYFLSEAGYETPAAIEESSTGDLTDVRYVGEATAERAMREASGYVDQQKGRPQGTVSDGDSDSDDFRTDVDSPSKRKGQPHSSKGETGGKSQTNGRDEAKSERSNDPEQKENTGRRDSSKNSSELDLLLIGSARPNLEHQDNAGLRVLASIQNAGYEIDDFDVAIYTGFVSPSSYHEHLDPRSFLEELIEQLGTIAQKLPFYYVTGDFGHGDPLQYVYDAGYPPNTRREPFASVRDEHTTYIPIQGSVPVGKFELTQNPTIAAEAEDSILVTPDLYPQLWESHDATAYIGGGQLTGRWSGDSLAPAFFVENVGPKRHDCGGACHAITVGRGGIQTHEHIEVGDVDLRSCDFHIDRGVQFVLAGTDCIFCRNERRYFEELFRSEVHHYDTLGITPDADAIIDSVSEKAHLDDHQKDQFRDYLETTLRTAHLRGTRPDSPVGATIPPDSDLIPDPRDVLDRMSLIASDQLNLRPHQRAAYFAQHNVRDPETMTATEAFKDVRPPDREEQGDGVVDLDEAAFKRNLLTGEWMLFPRYSVLGAVWEYLLEEVAKGTFYDVQLGTALFRQARGKKTDRGAVHVAVPNYFDLEDVLRVGERIEESEFINTDDLLTFKPLMYSILGINKANKEEYGLSYSSRFTLWNLRKLTS